MIEFIYTNENLELGIGGRTTNSNHEKIDSGYLNQLLKFSATIEEFHAFSFGVGTLIITDLDKKSFIIKPCCGLVEIYYLLEFLTSDSMELNYCIEEYFTQNQFDDEYCIEIKLLEIESTEMIHLKNNNQIEEYSFDKKPFVAGLINFSEKLINVYLKKFPLFKDSPILNQIHTNLNKLK